MSQICLTHEEEGNENTIFKARINSSKNVLMLLKAVNFREVSNICKKLIKKYTIYTSIFQAATFYISSKGLKVTVEDAKSVQANAFIQAELFQVSIEYMERK